jgi:hypothetical protein
MAACNRYMEDLNEEGKTFATTSLVNLFYSIRAEQNRGYSSEISSLLLSIP